MLRKEIHLSSKTVGKEVGDLFLEAFPEDERPPLFVFLRSIDKEQIKLVNFYDGDAFIGFAYLASIEDICCIFFLAVSATYRHQGYGGQILESLKEEYSEKVLMLGFEEVSPKYPNYEERVLRKAFYNKHGFIDNKIKTNEYGVIYETAYIGSHQVSFSKYLEIFKLVFGKNQAHNVTDATIY